MNTWHPFWQSLGLKTVKTLAHSLVLIYVICCTALPGFSQDATVHPELVTAHVTNLDMIFELSKFRSGAGHDFTYMRESLPAETQAVIDSINNFFATVQSEPESSMKHYYSPYAHHKQDNGDNTTIPVYAPFSGMITRVTEETREADSSIVNKRVEITASENTDYTVVLFHLNLDNIYPQIFNDYPTISGIWTHQQDDTSYSTRTVEAGDLLGYADMRLSNDFDIAVLFNDTSDDKWISLFELMSDSLFSEYEPRGAKRIDTIISKEYRQNNPVIWGMRNDDDWITFTAVPEPATLVLLLSALPWLGLRQRCR